MNGGTAQESETSTREPLHAPRVDTAAGLVTAMRALKEWSGLTYRQLQRRASDAGDVLPHSTIAAVLNRSTLPRQDLLAAFVRACGGGDDTVEAWLAVRRGIAVAAAEGRPESGKARGRPDRREAEPAAAAAEPAAPPARADTAYDVEPSPAVDPEQPPQSDEAPDLGAGTEPDATSEVPDQVAAEGDGWDRVLRPASSGTLASATAEQRRWRWRGIHRYDPADEIPRPTGLRWLVPPIMYRTGWPARMLSGMLVLLLVLVAAAFTVRVIRDRGERPDSAPVPSDAPVLETRDPGSPSPSSTSRAAATRKPSREQPQQAGPRADKQGRPTGRASAVPATTPAPAPTAPATGGTTSGGSNDWCGYYGCDSGSGSGSDQRPAPSFSESTSTSTCEYPCVEITTYGP